jgi:rhamnogalacturonan acetylesterase
MRNARAFASIVLLAAQLAAVAQQKENQPEAPKARTLYIVGGESAHDDGGRGWGDHLERFFNPASVTIANRAAPMNNTGGCFLGEAWTGVVAEMKEGDFVLVQMADQDRTEHTLDWCLRKLVSDTRARKATPVLLTPTVKNSWKSGKVERLTQSEETIHTVAATEKVDLADVATVEAEFLERTGERSSTAYFSANSSQSSIAGAELNAGFVIEALRRANSPLMETNPFMLMARFNQMTPLVTEDVTELNFRLNLDRRTAVAKKIIEGKGDFKVAQKGGRGESVVLQPPDDVLSLGGSVLLTAA